MRLTRYQDYFRRIIAFSSGDYSLMIVHGRQGTSKTYVARAALPEEVAHWIAGDCSESAMFEEIKAYRDEPLILDDMDNVHRDVGKVRLLKQLCQLRKPTTVTRRNMRQTRVRDADGVVVCDEGEVVTSSPVLIITNEWKRLNRHIQALEDRAVMIEFDPSSLEVHEYVSSWWDSYCVARDLDGREIFDWVGRHLELTAGQLSVRDYEIALLDQKHDLDWQNHLIQRWLQPRHMSIAMQLASSSLGVDEQYARFFEITKLSRTTFQNYRRQLGLLGQHGGTRPGAGRPDLD